VEDSKSSALASDDVRGHRLPGSQIPISLAGWAPSVPPTTRIIQCALIDIKSTDMVVMWLIE
jgi:hypothetical protein